MKQSAQLPVMEHFYTLQGEGKHSGRAAYFIRLAGCDVGCVWCDVKESWDISPDQYLTIEQLLTEVAQSNTDFVVITGGEPTMHNLKELTNALHTKGYEIAIETAKRGNDLLVPPVFGSGSDATGGCYDKEDVDRIIKRASANYIEVIPEFDLPGHNMSLIHLYPEMRDPEDKSNEVSVQGYRENTLNPAMPETLKIVESLIDDMCNQFPGEYIHLGGDEIAPGAWEKSPKVQALMKEHRLDNSKDVASWFINKLSKRVELNNKKTASWQEAEDGNHHDDKSEKLLFSWQNLESGLNLARQGYKVVLCPAEHIYFDMAQSRNYADRGANWAAVIPIESTVDWQIIPENEPELESNIQGIQGHLWSETILKDSEMESMLCPRILGLSESAWTCDANRRKGAELSNLAKNSFRELFDRIGWDYYIAENFDIMSDPAMKMEAFAGE